MTREEAEQQCKCLAAESPERETHRWIPRQEESGEWAVLKIGLPPNRLEGTPETRADEKPPTPGDPRTSPEVPPWAGPV
jgi:hypothetical protein